MTVETLKIIEVLINGNKIVQETVEGYYGMVDSNNKVICDFKYERIYDFKEGIGRLVLDDFHKGYIDVDGNIICDCIYESACGFYNGLAIVSKVYRQPFHYTMINRFGKEILPAIFRDLNHSKNYIIGIRENDDSEILLDKNLNIIFDSDKCFKEIREVRKDLFIVKLKMLDHLVDLNGKIITDHDLCNYADERKFEVRGNMIHCRNVIWNMPPREYYTYFNFSGFQFGKLSNLAGSRRLVEFYESGPSLHKYGYLDENGQIVIPCIFDDADDFIDGKALVKRKDTYYFINKRGRKVKHIFQYESFGKFHNSIAIVMKNGLFGIINANGDEIVNCKFQSLTRLKNGLLKTELLSTDSQTIKFGIFNDEGIEMLPPIYNRIHEFHNDRAVVSFDGKYGFIQSDGSIVIPLIYDSVEEFDNYKDKTGVCLADKWMEIDKFGKVINEDYIPTDYYDDNSNYTESELRDMNRAAYEGL